MMCVNCWRQRTEISSLSPQGGGEKISIQNLIRDTALDQLAPARALAADIGVELFRRARLGVQSGLFKPRRHRRIGIDGGDLALHFVDDRLRVPAGATMPIQVALSAM